MKKIIEKLKELDRWQVSLLLIAMSLFSFGISLTRYFVTDSKVFLFFNWNLFLAFIPWVISSLIMLKGEIKLPLLVGLIAVWILFFPNSPYILTDLFHLRVRVEAPIWFDLIVILSFAWTGLMYGFISLMDIEVLLQRYLSKRLITLLTISFLFLSSFGIYLGRFLRWNSWDIISNPTGLTYDIADRLINPFAHSRTWGLTILMGILLNMMYFSIKLLRGKK